MILTLRGIERQEYGKFFDQMFRLRHDVFVKGRGWSLPCGNGRETDQYDVDEAVYFLDINEDGVLSGKEMRAFPQYDADGDGEVTLAEFLKAKAGK